MIKVSYAGKLIKEYTLWTDMLKRCYSSQSLINNPTYTNTNVSENFKNFNYFYEWCQNQIGFGNQNWQIDKDILLKNNKSYHEDLCVFVPQEINLLFCKANKIRGKWPIGVYLRNHGKFEARCGNGLCKNIYLGLFDTSEQAFQAYKLYKENLLKEFANKFQNSIDIRLYNSLINYTVLHND